ncbi:unnamed protein product [Protopolystoma xenopodis]|uniref:F-box domain-containing protein n=1 Tax=Protopolystoma xenopodis TaxID=117903 RepID=A0A448WD38_9PLAT|nr:unnamed protein product [Protopolystoma xenopodis]
MDLSSCLAIDSDGFLPLGRLIRLRWLSLYRTKVTDAALANLAALCQRLEHLNLGACSFVHSMNRSILAIAKSNPGLISLDLWRSRNFLADGLLQLADLCPNLRELDIGWCGPVQNRQPGCVEYLVARCHRLQKLFLTALRSHKVKKV